MHIKSLVNIHMDTINKQVDFQLTPDQQNAYKMLLSFIESNYQVFILKGYAGTGKTTLLKEFAKHLTQHNRLGNIAAPTGRAARVIEKITTQPSSTIHRLIYNMKSLKTIEEKDEEGKQSFKYFFEISQNTDDNNKVYIVDEASMISNNYSDAEFFRYGSGHLLNDLLQYADLHTLRNHKIIFVGDPAQLPPVGSNVSLALEAHFFEEKELKVLSYELTQVVRQQKDSGILFNASRLRHLIISKKRNENVLDINFNDVHSLSIETIIEKYLELTPLPDISKTILIAFSNSLVHDYNSSIRAKYFPDQQTICEGDILQIIKNNYKLGIHLFNGDFVKVLEVDPIIEKKSAAVFFNNEKKIVSLNFRTIKIQKDDGSILEIKLIESLLNSKYRDLSSVETKTLYINFVMRFNDTNKGKFTTKSSEFKDALQNDPYFNALRAKYGYAITGHKSQGGTWQNVMVDFTGRKGLNSDSLRWSYTAISRVSKELFVINQPNIKQIDFKKSSHKIGIIKSLPKDAIVFPEIKETPFHSIQSLAAKRLKYFEIEEKCFDFTYKIMEVQSFDYQETYTIRINERELVFDLWHNLNGVFTKVQCRQDDVLANEFLKEINTAIPANIPIEYTPQNNELEKLNSLIYAALEDVELNIIGIDDSRLENYYINYYFSGANSHMAYIQFYFNKDFRFTNLIAKSSIGIDDLELEKLLDQLSYKN